MFPGPEMTEPFWVLTAKRQVRATTAWRSRFRVHWSHAHTEAGTGTVMILDVVKRSLQDSSLTELLRASAWWHTGHVDTPRRQARVIMNVRCALGIQAVLCGHVRCIGPPASHAAD